MDHAITSRQRNKKHQFFICNLLKNQKEVPIFDHVGKTFGRLIVSPSKELRGASDHAVLIEETLYPVNPKTTWSLPLVTMCVDSLRAVGPFDEIAKRDTSIGQIAFRIEILNCHRDTAKV